MKKVLLICVDIKPPVVAGSNLYLAEMENACAAQWSWRKKYKMYFQAMSVCPVLFVAGYLLGWKTASTSDGGQCVENFTRMYVCPLQSLSRILWVIGLNYCYITRELYQVWLSVLYIYDRIYIKAVSISTCYWTWQNVLKFNCRIINCHKYNETTARSRSEWSAAYGLT